MNWPATVFIAIGVVLIIVGWNGTHNKIVSVLFGSTPTGTTPTTSQACPAGNSQGSCSAGFCEIVVATGKTCVPSASVPAINALVPGSVVLVPQPTIVPV